MLHQKKEILKGELETDEDFQGPPIGYIVALFLGSLAETSKAAKDFIMDGQILASI